MDRAGTRQQTRGTACGCAAAAKHDHVVGAGEDFSAGAAADGRRRHVRAAAGPADVLVAHQACRIGDRARSGTFDVLGTAERVQSCCPEIHRPLQEWRPAPLICNDAFDLTASEIPPTWSVSTVRKWHWPVTDAGSGR